MREFWLLVEQNWNVIKTVADPLGADANSQWPCALLSTGL
jgi:hypothetical protein